MLLSKSKTSSITSKIFPTHTYEKLNVFSVFSSKFSFIVRSDVFSSFSWRSSYRWNVQSKNEEKLRVERNALRSRRKLRTEGKTKSTVTLKMAMLY